MITVKYRCNVCGTEFVEVQVPARDDPEREDVVQWMERVSRCCGCHHRGVFPDCKGTALDLMVPLPNGSEFVGQQIE